MNEAWEHSPARLEEKQMSLKLNDKYVRKFISDDEFTGIKAQTETAAKTLHDRNGLGSDFLGWLDLPVDYDKEEFASIKAAAEKIKKMSLSL